MKYFKLIKQLGWTSFKKGIIYTEDFKTRDNLVVGNLATIGLNPQDWQEVTEKEYWQQELDAGKLVNGGYYVNSKHVIHKHSGTSDAEYYINWNQQVFSRNKGNFATVQRNNFYKLATDDEIEYLEYCNKQNKFISKEDFMKSKEFVLPEKWKIKDCKEVAEWASKQFGCDYTVGPNYLCIDQNTFPHNQCFLFLNYTDSTFTYYTEITFEQFKKYVLKQEEEMSDKKIIGYKLIKPEYEKAALKITGCDEYGWCVNVNYDMTASSIGAHKAKEAEVLDKWFEKVFEEEYKIGDWVYVVSGGTGAYGANDFIGQICSKSIAVNVNYGGQHKDQQAEFYIINQNESWGLCKGYEIKKATHAEIEKSKLPIISIQGYDAKLSDHKVSFGCQTYDREFVLQLGEFLENSGLKIESQDEIMKVVEYFKNK